MGILHREVSYILTSLLFSSNECFLYIKPNCWCPTFWSYVTVRGWTGPPTAAVRQLVRPHPACGLAPSKTLHQQGRPGRVFGRSTNTERRVGRKGSGGGLAPSKKEVTEQPSAVSHFWWRWRESNPRPNTALKGFLHAYPSFDCRRRHEGRRP